MLCSLLTASNTLFAAVPEVIIDPGGAPPEVLHGITDAVDAITRLAQDQDVREVARLRRRAWEAAHAALQTQGYFAAQVDLEVSEGLADQGEFWDINIDPGPRTKVHSFGIAYLGTINNDKYADRRKALRDGWLLKPGATFIDSNWSSAKTNLLDNITQKDFYFARYEQTHAIVDPDQAEADLSLLVDSGPAVKLGKLKIEGLKRVPESLVRRYVQYEEGDSYEQIRLDEWQQALQATPFFWGAFVTLDEADTTDNPDANLAAADADSVSLPVKVQVTEGMARSFSSSIGVDSDHGVRVEGLYKQNVVNGWPISIETGAGIDKDRQRFFFDVHLPPAFDGNQDSIGLLYEHSDVSGLDVSRTGLGWKRSQTRKAAGASRVEYEVKWNAVVAHDKTRISGSDKYEVPSWALGWQWLRRDVNSKYDPREGNLIEFGLGAGTTLDDGKAFSRASIRAQQWWPVGDRDVISIRGEIGKVWSQTDRLPQSFLWRTGGARSIRGYRYQSIGLEQGHAIVGAPVLGAFGVEYTHYFTDMLGMNIFVDAGDAAESIKSFKWHLGYGAGLAVRTPAGPLYVDLAWAQRDRRLRLQFSMGMAF